MTTDRTTKTLLLFIAVALWGILLRPLFSPARSEAQALTTPVRIVGVSDNVVLPVDITRPSPLEIKAAPGITIPVDVQK